MEIASDWFPICLPKCSNRKGVLLAFLNKIYIFFDYKDCNYKTEDLAFACIQAQGLPQLSLKLMPLFVGNAFGSSAKVLFASD